jgi:hypothetical protein
MNRCLYHFTPGYQQYIQFLKHCVQNTRNPGMLEETYQVNHLISGSLVERNTEPEGIQLMNPFAVAKCESTDLVELAREIQKVSI